MNNQIPNNLENAEQKESSDCGEGINLCRKGFYNHGAHAGNVYYRIEAWGMNSPLVEAEIRKRLDAFISHLLVGWTGS